MPQLSYPSAPDPDVVRSDDQSLDDEVLALEPILKPQPKLLSLDEKTILTAARANVLSQITVNTSPHSLLCNLTLRSLQSVILLHIRFTSHVTFIIKFNLII